MENSCIINTSEKNLSVSEKLKKIRKEFNLTQIQLAKKLNLSKGQIGNIEANIRPAIMILESKKFKNILIFLYAACYLLIIVQPCFYTLTQGKHCKLVNVDRSIAY